MISNELSTIQAKDAERAAIDLAMAAFSAAGGQVQVTPIKEFKAVGEHVWNRNDMVLPGSSQNTQKLGTDEALIEKLRELVAKGAGITSIKMTLRIDDRCIKRLADENGITISKVYCKERVIGEKARQGIVDAGRLRRSKMVPKISALARQGLTIAQIASAAECSKATVLRVINEFGIQRAPRMALEA